MSNCLIIAGEKSGEEHCLSFFDQLKKEVPHTTFWGVGGDSLSERGLELLYHLNDFSSWGFSEVITKIPFYWKALKKIEREVIQRKTKTAILIDFQTFNLKLAQRLKKRGVRILYYVAPQAWAWKSYRARVIERTVHTLFTIIPFEKKWFGERGVKRIRGVEHPVLRAYKQKIQEIKSDDSYSPLKKLNLLLLPGSRNFEVQSLLPEFLKVCQQLNHDLNLPIEIALVPSPSVKKDHYQNIKGHRTFSHEDLDEALNWADICLASSGTVTLTTALFCVPTIVCYKTSFFNELIFDTFVDYSGFISLANIVHEKEVFPEFIQERANAYNITSILYEWITNHEKWRQIKFELGRTQKLLEGDDEKVELVMAKVIKDADSLESPSRQGVY